MFVYVDTKGPDLDCSKVEFDALVPPSVTKDEPYATSEGSVSDYCEFAQVLLSLPSMEDTEYDFDQELSLIVTRLVKHAIHSFCIRIAHFVLLNDEEGSPSQTPEVVPSNARFQLYDPP